MTNLETELLKSGFTAKEVGHLKRNVERYGSSLLEVVLELGNRFRMVISITIGVMILFAALVLFSEQHNIISGGVSLVIVLLITWFFQPPVITYKAWRYRKKYLNSAEAE